MSEIPRQLGIIIREFKHALTDFGIAIALVFNLFLGLSLFSCHQSSLSPTIAPSVSSSASPVINQENISEIAQQISVRILTANGSGSGVIIKREGQVYTVLTNYHVANDQPEKGYTILTFDGKTYQGKWLNKTMIKNLDATFLQFNSTQIYQRAKIGNSNNLKIGNLLYASGFPAWNFSGQDNQITSLESTRELGIEAFEITKGKVLMFSELALQGGYQIGYTNEIVPGMSGGPILNQQGELVGINGQLKYPFQGQEAFIFIDGTQPSQEVFEKMEALSWGIPIHQIALGHL
jgi:S1-C subfamily serine protease